MEYLLRTVFCFFSAEDVYTHFMFKKTVALFDVGETEHLAPSNGAARSSLHYMRHFQFNLNNNNFFLIKSNLKKNKNTAQFLYRLLFVCLFSGVEI